MDLVSLPGIGKWEVLDVDVVCVRCKMNGNGSFEKKKKKKNMTLKKYRRTFAFQTACLLEPSCSFRIQKEHP